MNNDLLTLERILRRALRFFDLRDNSRRVFDVIIDYSFAAGQPAARFTSQRVLHLETALAKNRVSEALSDLVASRMILRDGKGKGGLLLTPLPDWWNWACRTISPAYADREFLGSLIGFYVARTGSAWTITSTALHPVLAYATAHNLGAFDHPQLFAPEQTLNDAVAAVAREEALGQTPVVPPAGTDPAAAGAEIVPPGGTTRRLLSSINPTTTTSILPSSIPEEEGGTGEGEGFVPPAGTTPTTSTDELILMAEKLWPTWPANRRDPFLAKLAATSRRATYTALCRAKHAREPIRAPWAWLSTTVTNLRKDKAAGGVATT